MDVMSLPISRASFIIKCTFDSQYSLITGYGKCQRYLAILVVSIVIHIFSTNILAQSPVIITEVAENIPTYLAGPPDPNPMFFFGKGSQGAEGRIYPYPLYDNLAIPHYVTGLGYAGIGNKKKAQKEFNAALVVSPDFLRARIALDQF